MATFSRLQKLAVASLGAIGGSLTYYKLNSGEKEKKYDGACWSTNDNPSVKWDSNWDQREPEALVQPVSGKKAEDENRYNEQIENAKSKAVRHIFMIRHGQYYLDGSTDKERVLTELGRRQAELTGQRLKKLDINWDLLVRSTLTRAQETGSIIAEHINNDCTIRDCQLLEEGAPIPPEPPTPHWKPDRKQFFQDGARIEAAFRKYFHRASPEQKEDSYTLLVCHANVIRFFVCKAMQFPPEAWLRISLGHGSITWVSILPNGHVILRSLSDTGFMEPQFVSTRNSVRNPAKKKLKNEV